MNLLATMCLMLLAACAASALTCKNCWYAEVEKGRGSNNTEVEEMLDSLEGGVEECKKQGEDYTYAKTETCPVGADFCAMRRFNYKVTFNSVECEMEIFFRSCVPVNQSLTTSAGCHQEDLYYEEYFLDYPGVSSTVIAGDACYCSSDLCNAASTVLMSGLIVALAAVLAITAAGVAIAN